MRVKTLLVTGTIVFAFSACAFAGDIGCQQGESPAAMMDKITEGTAAVEVGNKICPVSGESVGDMGPAAQYEYEGKIYNFCCPACIEKFKKDPKKYIDIVQEQMGEGAVKQVETSVKGQAQTEAQKP